MRIRLCLITGTRRGGISFGARKNAGISSSELFHVQEVLFPCACQLIADEVLFRYNYGRNFSIDQALNAVLPSFVEADTVNLLQDVDSRRRLADLEDGAIRKICRTQPFQRSSKLSQSSEDCLAILVTRLNKHIEILRCSRFSMNAESIASNDEVLNGVCIERS